jgi:cytochrome b561
MQAKAYDKVSIWLHWLVAAAVVIQFATGWVWAMFERGSDPRLVLFRIHIAVGTLILALALVRVGWRLTHKAPPLPEGMSRLTMIASKATHALLYLAILIQPALGLLTITAFGKSLGRWPREMHMTLVNVIAAIIVLHVAAAIWHQFIRRDGLIRRMLPARIEGARS